MHDYLVKILCIGVLPIVSACNAGGFAAGMGQAYMASKGYDTDSGNSYSVPFSNNSTSRLNSSGTRIYHSDGSSSRISSSGRRIYNSDGSSCRISSSGRYIYC